MMQALSIRRQIDALERRLRGLVGGRVAACDGCCATRGQTPESAGFAGGNCGSGEGSFLGANQRPRRRIKKAGKKRKGGMYCSRVDGGLSQLMKARWAARRKGKVSEASWTSRNFREAD